MLRQQIIVGRYAQGSRLVEATLAADLHVSRIPIREAVPQLEKDGFVRTLPRRSTRVFEWTAADVTELFDVRLSLEVLAARLAAQRVSAGANVDSLADAITAEHEALASGDWLQISEASTVFHERIIDLAGSELLGSLMRAVTGRMTWLFYLTSARDQHVQSDEHHGLLDAIGSGNERLAENVAYAHIEMGRKPSLELVLGRQGQSA
jgi:DNA-binding GntR family transcriptional regulator